MIGGGLAGLSSAVALAEAGFHVRLLEKRPHLGGRAASYVLPGGEHIDNCQHVTLGCCTNLEDFYRRLGAADQIRFFNRLLFAAPDGRRGAIASVALPPPLHMAPSFVFFPLLGLSDKRAIAEALLRQIRCLRVEQPEQDVAAVPGQRSAGANCRHTCDCDCRGIEPHRKRR